MATQLVNTTGVSIRVAGSTAGGTSARLDAMDDVVESAKSNGNILVYNSTTGNYILSAPDADGGTF